MSNISKNSFYQFLKDYTNYISWVKTAYNEKSLYKKNIKNLRDGIKHKKVFNIPQYEYTGLKINLETIRNTILDNSIDNWLFIVKEFIEFLDFSDLSCLFKNDKTETSLYVDCDIKHSAYTLYYYDEDYETEYRLSFLDTEIPNLDYKPLESFISDSGSKYMTLIQLDIIRNYGEKRCNQIKLVGNNNDSILKNTEDLYIFNIIKIRLSKVILDTLYDILGNVNKSYGFEKEITTEVLDGYITIN